MKKKSTINTRDQQFRDLIRKVYKYYPGDKPNRLNNKKTSTSIHQMYNFGFIPQSQKYHIQAKRSKQPGHYLFKQSIRYDTEDRLIDFKIENVKINVNSQKKYDKKKQSFQKSYDTQNLLSLKQTLNSIKKISYEEEKFKIKSQIIPITKTFTRPKSYNFKKSQPLSYSIQKQGQLAIFNQSMNLKSIKKNHNQYLRKKTHFTTTSKQQYHQNQSKNILLLQNDISIDPWNLPHSASPSNF